MGDPSRPGTRGTLWLVGMFGSDRTSVGRSVAAATRTRFVDVDTEVADTIGVSIPEFWDLHGDVSVRGVEEQVVERIAGIHGVVGAGESVVIRSGDVMRGTGVVIWLRTAPEEYAARSEPIGPMGLWDGASDHQIAVALRNRIEVCQEAAHHVVDTHGLSVDEVTEEVIRLWRGSP